MSSLVPRLNLNFDYRSIHDSSTDSSPHSHSHLLSSYKESKSLLSSSRSSSSSSLPEANDYHVLDLPTEILTHIFTLCNPRDLLQLERVCQKFSVVARQPLLWRDRTMLLDFDRFCFNSFVGRDEADPKFRYTAVLNLSSKRILHLCRLWAIALHLSSLFLRSRLI